MHYFIRAIISLLFLYVIYKSFKVLQYQKNNETFLNYMCDIQTIHFNIDKQKREEAYEKLGTPEEWYKFKNEGYSYIDPKYWDIPQKREPVCYNENGTHPAPIMSPGTDTSLFYNPTEGDKYVNEDMNFEKKPQIIYKTTIYSPVVKYAKV